MNIRPATAADAQRIALLHAESWRTAYRNIYRDDFLDGPVFADRETVWRDRFAAPKGGQGVLVAEHDGALEGFVCVFGDEDGRWGSLIDNLHVAPSNKRSGTGTALMREAARWLEEEYARSGVYLWVLEANAPARRFYERLGARNAETAHHESRGGGSAPGCRYVWPSPAALEQACS